MSNPTWTEEEKLLFESASKTTPFDLPIGVYIVATDGRFLEANRLLREMLHLPLNGTIGDNIGRFYADHNDRDRITKLVDATRPLGKFCNNQRVRFLVNGSELWVNITCCAISYPNKVDLTLGYIGYLIDVTEEVKLNNLFDRLPAGVYRLDKNDNIVFVNQAVISLLGYDKPDDLIGRTVKILYPDAKDEEIFKMKLIAEDNIEGEHLVLLKKSGEKIHVLVTASALKGENNEYIGREGIIVNENAEAIYRELFEGIPVGTYEIDMSGANEKVIACNTEFIRIFGFDFPDQVIGTDIWKEVFHNIDGHKQYMDEMYLAHTLNKPLLRHDLHVKKKNGESIIVEVHARLLTDRSGNITRRVGVLRDVSNEVALRELRDNIGRTLHHYSSGLIMIQHSLSPIRKMIGRTSTGEEIVRNFEELIEFLDEIVLGLQKKLSVLLANEFKSKLAKILGTDKYEFLRREFLNLEDYKKRIPYRELHVPAIRDSVSIIIELLENIVASKESLPIAEASLYSAEEIERLCCFDALLNVQERILEMEFQVRSLREFVTSHERMEEHSVCCSAQTIIISAISELWEYSNFRHIKIEHINESDNAVIEVQQRAMTRAIGNLLHNAIKYSWSKQTEKPVVKLYHYIKDDKVVIEVRNWGVAITKEEIEKELIFEIGYRGIKSGIADVLGPE